MSANDNSGWVPVYEDWNMIGRPPVPMSRWQMARAQNECRAHLQNSTTNPNKSKFPSSSSSSGPGGEGRPGAVEIPSGHSTPHVMGPNLISSHTPPSWGKKYSFTSEWFRALNGLPPLST